jgi:hypothetical protein
MALFVQTLTKDVLAPLVAEEEEASTHYMFGLDVVSWLPGAAGAGCSPCCLLSCFGSHFIPSYRAYSAGSIFGHLSQMAWIMGFIKHFDGFERFLNILL